MRHRLASRGFAAHGPLPTRAGAEDIGHGAECDGGVCLSCKQEPATEGMLYCESCREAVRALRGKRVQV